MDDEKKKAREYIWAYMDRGGKDEGDTPTLLSGTNLLNEVGVALGLPVSDFSTWTTSEWERASRGELCFFKGESRKAIDVVVDKMKEEVMKRSDSVYVVVIPVAFISKEAKLYPMCVFRAREYKDDSWQFFDNTGRVYDSFQDFRKNNLLPPGIIHYPKDGFLGRFNEEVEIRWATTPSGRTVGRVIEVFDVVAGVTGIVGGVGAMVLSGGLALPFVVAGAGAAIYGTGRSVYQLVDRGTHGQSVNPFSDYSAFSLWLGIGANIISFGAMSATMRLTSLAVRGKTVSDGFMLIVNIVNGTSFVCNTAAMANGLVYFAIHFEDMTPTDMLMQMASIAFWAKSAYSFQSAGHILKTVRDQAVNGYTSGLKGDDKVNFDRYRANLNNDEVLVKLYYNGAKNQIDPTQISKILLETINMGTHMECDPSALTVRIQGNTFDLKFLTQIKPADRQQIFGIVGGLDARQAAGFNEMRAHVSNDAAVFNLVGITAREFGLTPQEATHGLIDFWSHLNNNRMQLRANAEGVFVVGNGHQFTLPQIVKLSRQPNVMQVIVRDILPLPAAETVHFNKFRALSTNQMDFYKWITAASSNENGFIVKRLVSLESIALPNNLRFSSLITSFVVADAGSGYDIVCLRDHVNLSIKFLINMEAALRSEMLLMIHQTKINADGTLQNFKNRREFGIQSEIVRTQARNWLNTYTVDFCPEIQRFPAFRTHDLNRLHYLKIQMESLKLPESQSALRVCVFKMQPKNVTEFVSYHDFARSYLDKCRQLYTPAQYKEYEKNARQNNSKPLKKVQWSEQKAAQEVRVAANVMQLFAEYRQIAIDHRMFDTNMLRIPAGLGGSELVKAIVSTIKAGNQVKFASEISATTHIFKHEAGGLFEPRPETKNYVKVANETIIHLDATGKASWNQEGTSRTIEFTLQGRGKVILLETSNGVLLCTFIEGSRAAGA